MKFREILRFELGFQLGRVTIWIYIIAVLTITALAAWSLLYNVQMGEYFLNSPATVSLLAAVGSIFGCFLTAAVVGSGTVRDIQTGIYPLIYTTPIKKFTYLAGKFMAAFSIQIVVIAVSLFLLHISSLIPAWEELFTESKAASFLDAFFLFSVPNAFFTTAIIFSLGVLTKRSMAGYLGAALLFFISLMTTDILAKTLGMWELGKILDPSGITLIREIQLVQTPVEIKSAFLSLTSSILFNRIIWIVIGFGFLIWAYLRFNFVHQAVGRKKSGKIRIIDEEKGIPDQKTVSLAPVISRAFDLKMELKQVLYLFLNSFSNMLNGKVWILIVVITFFLLAASNEFLTGQLKVPVFATTWKVLELLNNLPAVGMLVAAIISFYAGEFVWEERDARINEIIDVSPVQDWVLFVSKLAALILMIIFIQTIFFLSGVILQLAHQFNEIDLWLYIKVLYGFRFIDLVLFAVFALIIHVIINQKYLGHLVVLLAIYYMDYTGSLGLNHNLLIFGSDPGLSYSDFNQFNPHLTPWLWFKLYWANWALLLLIGIHLFWNRGKEISFSKRVKNAKLKISGIIVKAGISIIVVIFLLGGYIYYNTNILNTYLTMEEIFERKALYEKTYGKFDRIPQPQLSGIKLNGEIYPDRQIAEIEGEYLLINKTEGDLDTIHVSTTSGTKIPEMKFSRNFKEIEIDNLLGHRIYKLTSPLKPGDSVYLEFKIIFDSDGFTNNGINTSVAKNGTHIDYTHMPDIGYKTSREISDSLDRKKYKLFPQTSITSRSIYDEEARMDLFGAEELTFEAVLGTTKEQTAVTAGTFQKSWLANGRRYFRYKTDAPIRHNYEIYSAVYGIYKGNWKNVEINIYHHPKHTFNLDRMVKGMAASLDYFTKNFSPYPHRELNIVEYPGNHVGLSGNPVTMSYAEGFSFFKIENDAEIADFPFAVIAHEVAHQWWGGQLRPAYVEGAGVLSESLAWYSSMMVVEETYGKDHLKRLHQVLKNDYLTPRSAADVPLLKANDKFNLYRKGPFALYTLKEYIGEKNVNLALKRLLEKFKPGQPPLPTSLDLYAELKTVTPDSLQYLVKDLIEKNTFWEMEGGTATAKPDGNGNWNITYKPIRKKITVNEKGIFTEVPMNDYIEIGIYGISPEGKPGGSLYLKKHRLQSGDQPIQIQVSKEPGLAVIDPNNLLIDRNIYNNFAKIKLAK